MFLNGIFEGFYLTVMLSMGVEFFFDPFHLKQGKISPAMRLFGLAMLFEFLCSLTGVAFNTIVGGCPFMWHVSHFFDINVGCLLCLAGFSILQGKYPSWKLTISIILPVLAATIPSFFGIYEWHVTAIIVYTYEICILAYQVMMFRRHDNRLKDFYSNTEKYETLWVSWYIVYFIFNTTLYFTTYLNYSWGDIGALIYSLMLIAFYSYMGVRLLKLDVATNMLAIYGDAYGEKGDESEEDATPSSRLSEEMSEQFDALLTRLMEEEKMYHRQDLCTDDLTKALGTNSSYLYYFLRDVKGSRFYDYVNGYRIEEAKQLLSTTDWKIEVIAGECGFNSYNTFVAAFKKSTGASPSHWRKNQG